VAQLIIGLRRFAAAGETDIELDRRDLLARRRPPEPGVTNV
jgi:hypothetical protein